ncbi:MAG: ornithine cyclodeaminase family protein, partial [Halobacteriota archaeon]
RWQTRAIATACDLESVRIYSPSDSKRECANDLREEGIDATAVDSPAAAVSEATVVVTATTSTEPTFAGGDLRSDALVVAIGAFTPEMRELDVETLERAAAIYADVPEEAIETGDVPDSFARDVQPLGGALENSSIEGERDGIVVVKSVGSATLDAAAAGGVYDAARERDVGRTIDLDC